MTSQSAGYRRTMGSRAMRAGDPAKSAAEGGHPDGTVPDEYRWRTSLSHMTRAASETKSCTAAQWIASHTSPERKYRSPRGNGFKHKQSQRAVPAILEFLEDTNVGKMPGQILMAGGPDLEEEEL